MLAVPTHDNTKVYAVFQNAVQNRQVVERIVLQELGHRYHLDGVLDLPQLRLSTWPYTRVGKLSIADLTVKVGEYVASLKELQQDIPASKPLE